MAIKKNDVTVNLGLIRIYLNKKDLQKCKSMLEFQKFSMNR